LIKTRIQFVAYSNSSFTRDCIFDFVIRIWDKDT
jgi:hypothetical protein